MIRRNQKKGQDLMQENKQVAEHFDAKQKKAAQDFAEKYKHFLDTAKTEREFVTEAIRVLEAARFTDIRKKNKLKPGDRVYRSIRGKGLMAAVIGKQNIENGMNIVGAHVDSPRVDLKPNPLFEKSDLAYFSTHYYGGIKKYQWTAIPLALHGVIFQKNGEKLTLSIGEEEGDPVFCFTDLLPHLAAKQMAKTGRQVVEGEELNLLVGASFAEGDEAKDRTKRHLMNLLSERYDIDERAFNSAELEITPAGKARDLGFDRSMIAAYGQDDRVCAFCALEALLNQDKTPLRTAVCMLSDKEEIGSTGSTGAQSRLYENFLAELVYKSMGKESELSFRLALEASAMLSTDVTNAYDPTFANVSDPDNNTYLGRGTSIFKYTGVAGKSNASDADSEFMHDVLTLFDSQNLPWQVGELGKVDEGGGGTICKFAAQWGINALDAGVPVLSMHAPMEVTHKLDVYCSYLAYQLFLSQMWVKGRD